MADRGPLIYELNGIEKRRSAGDATFELRVDKLAIRAGDKIALTGRSGSGKSTLLDILALVLCPDRCAKFVFHGARDDRKDVDAVWRRRDEAALAHLRRRHIGYVLQTGGLFPFLTVADNIGLPRRLLGLSDQQCVRRLADQLGLTAHLAKRPGELSVGERQRVAVARALAHDPQVVIADEPTASLDPPTADAVMNLFMQQVQERGIAAIVASHEWQRVEALGLTPLRQSITVDAAANTVRTTFAQ